MWQYSRVDHLAPQAVCVFCNRQLRSLKGIVVTDGQIEAYAGPNCAKRMLGPPDERLLDVTGLALLVVSDKVPGSQLLTDPSRKPGSVPQSGFGPAALPSSRHSLPPTDIEIQYLRLRYEFMHEFSHHRSALLNDAFDSYAESGVLNERQRKLVAGLIRNAAVQNLVFSEPNVKRCIGLNYWLHEALSNTRPERRGFLEAMLRALHRLWSLSPSQIMAINKWGERLRERVHSFPHIDPRVFEGVRIPAFMQSKNSSGK